MRLFDYIRSNIIQAFLIFLLLFSFASLSACKSTQADYVYRDDERALLQLAVENVLRAESEKDYATIYDQYAGQTMQDFLSRRDFMTMSNCAETYLGPVSDFDGAAWKQNPLEFERKSNKQIKQPTDNISLKIYRANGMIHERMAFIKEGVGFKLVSLQWHARNQHFSDCIRSVFQGTAEQALEEEPSVKTTEPVPEPEAPVQQVGAH